LLTFLDPAGEIVHWHRRDAVVWLAVGLSGMQPARQNPRDPILTQPQQQAYGNDPPLNDPDPACPSINLFTLTDGH
jgi:hypothetical protein